MRSRAYARHVLEKLAILTVGAALMAPPVRRLTDRLAAGGPPPVWPHGRLAIVAHLYYLVVLPEILACQAVLPPGTTLHLTVPEDRVAMVRQRLAGASGAVVHPVANRGRDIAPFLELLRAAVFDPFTAVLKIHGKRSVHLLDGDVRRRLLFSRLCGRPQATARALRAFADPTTGIVGWRACFRTYPAYWMGNEARVVDLAEQMGTTARLGFFEGSMFWFRPSALGPLRALDLRPDDFEPESGQTDGALHHAVERCFTIAAWAAGYAVRDLHGRPLSPDDETARRRSEPTAPTVRDGATNQARGSRPGGR